MSSDGGDDGDDGDGDGGGGRGGRHHAIADSNNSPLQVFVLMQFDPGMEYQPGWGDGESQVTTFVSELSELL